MMDERGNVIFIIIGAFILIALIPPILMMLFPPIQILFQIMMIFMLYSIVRAYMGDGPLTLILSAILIYFLVFKYTYIFASLWVFQMLLGVQFLSVVIWGVGTTMRGK